MKPRIVETWSLKITTMSNSPLTWITKKVPKEYKMHIREKWWSKNSELTTILIYWERSKKTTTPIEGIKDHFSGMNKYNSEGNLD